MIGGFFDPAAQQWPAPYVRVFLYLPNITRGWVAVPFLLDTGATSTCLHPHDAVHSVGIDPKALGQPQGWANPQLHGGVGGQGAMYFRVPVHYRFRHDDGRFETIVGQIDIAQLRPDNQALPSLLGRNILEHFRVVVDRPGNHVTLG